MGAEVMQSLTPGQQVVKIVHEELTALMGERRLGALLRAAGRRPCADGRPAGLGQDHHLRQAGAHAGARQGAQPALVACDVYRPAAIEQLQTLGKQVGCRSTSAAPTPTRSRSRACGVEQARAQRPRRGHRRHRRPPARRRGADGRAHAHQAARQAARRPARARLDDRPGRRQRRRGLQRARSTSTASSSPSSTATPAAAPRCRCARSPASRSSSWRRREARRARAVPPRPDGLPHPRHGRRAVADRAGPGARRRGGGQAMESKLRKPSSPSRTSWASCARCARWASLAGLLGMLPGVGRQ